MCTDFLLRFNRQPFLLFMQHAAQSPLVAPAAPHQPQPQPPPWQRWQQACAGDEALVGRPPLLTSLCCLLLRPRVCIKLVLWLNVLAAGPKALQTCKYSSCGVMCVTSGQCKVVGGRRQRCCHASCGTHMPLGAALPTTQKARGHALCTRQSAKPGMPTHSLVFSSRKSGAKALQFSVKACARGSWACMMGARPVQRGCAGWGVRPACMLAAAAAAAVQSV